MTKIVRSHGIWGKKTMCFRRDSEEPLDKCLKIKEIINLSHSLFEWHVICIYFQQHDENTYRGK